MERKWAYEPGMRDKLQTEFRCSIPGPNGRAYEVTWGYWSARVKVEKDVHHAYTVWIVHQAPTDKPSMRWHPNLIEVP